MSFLNIVTKGPSEESLEIRGFLRYLTLLVREQEEKIDQVSLFLRVHEAFLSPENTFLDLWLMGWKKARRKKTKRAWGKFLMESWEQGWIGLNLKQFHQIQEVFRVEHPRFYPRWNLSGLKKFSPLPHTLPRLSENFYARTARPREPWIVSSIHSSPHPSESLRESVRKESSPRPSGSKTPSEIGFHRPHSRRSAPALPRGFPFGTVSFSSTSSSPRKWGLRSPRDISKKKAFAFWATKHGPSMLAQEWSAREWTGMKRLSWRELLVPSGPRPHLEAIQQHFIRQSFWVVQEILVSGEMDLSFLAIRIGRLISLARQCWKRGNWNSVFAVLSGLNEVSVRRLTEVWDKISSKKREQFQSLDAWTNPMKNYREYRQQCPRDDEKKVWIPFFALIQRDVSTLLEVVPSYDEAGNLNTEKVVALHHALQGLLPIQQKENPFFYVPEVSEYWDAQTPSLDTEGWYQKSLQKFPPRKEKAVRFDLDPRGLESDSSPSSSPEIASDQRSYLKQAGKKFSSFDWLTKDPSLWTSEEVIQYLQYVGWNRKALDRLRAQQIDGARLIQLTEEDLIAMKISSSAKKRTQLLKPIHHLI